MRELISNAFDADATEVVILTDAPRFSKVIVRDNGAGLTPQSLENLLEHIGGSLKRTPYGAKLDVVNQSDPTRSPGGRKLIGKLGIGLFSVAQLTPHFQVITKTKGSDFRTIADIVLTIPSEKELEEGSTSKRPQFQTGHAEIRTVDAEDHESQGTEIILFDLLPRTRDELASRDRWDQLEYQKAPGAESLTVPPRYHIGRSKAGNRDVLETQPALPWNDKDGPRQRFEKLVEAITKELEDEGPNPSLEKIFDNYLRLLWTLSLEAPLEYVESHPFDLTTTKGIQFFQLSNEPRGKAEPLKLGSKQTPRAKCRLKAPTQPKTPPFKVLVDGVQLLRPIRFKNVFGPGRGIQTPMMFVAKCQPDLKHIPPEVTGGDLAFEAYLFWTPKVVPKEHRGVLVRIGEASGTLFDPDFLGYQVSELTRLNQITSEIFVFKGLDPAINLDRESFNYAHPHYQMLVKWLHNAIKQVTNKHKELGKHFAALRATVGAKTQSDELRAHVAARLKGLNVDQPIEVVFTDPAQITDEASLRRQGKLVFHRTRFSGLKTKGKPSPKAQANRHLLETKIITLAQLLDGWGTFEGLSYEDQEQLVSDVVEILTFGNNV
ncbi:MAG TPA: ATP-binding protein [Candidatus Acidoferrum sp.]|nr:ATP-binding protein [Candidatus Acidoferrum sp.]